jgi:hypothetical protein
MVSFISEQSWKYLKESELEWKRPAWVYDNYHLTFIPEHVIFLPSLPNRNSGDGDVGVKSSID